MEQPDNDDRGRIVPSHWRSRNQLEREADEILKAAFKRLGKTGAVKDNEARRVWSLDIRDDQDPGPDLTLEDSGIRWDKVDHLMAVLREDTTLTGRELELVQVIAEGTIWGGWRGSYDRVAALLGITHANARKIWERAKKKLLDQWANEPEPWGRTPLKHSIEGGGFLVINGTALASPGTPRVDPNEAREAMIRYEESAWRDTDWRHERSLTDDGWQLGDDSLWQDWEVPEP